MGNIRELERTLNGAKNLERTLEAAYVEIADLKSKLADAQQDNIGLLHLLALIREACGDNGKRMQDDLAAYIRDEWQGHLSHIALLKATLKAERAEADAMREALRHIEGLALAEEPRDLKNIGEIARAAAPLEKK